MLLKKKITVNRHIIAANKKNGTSLRPLSIQMSGKPVKKASNIEILDENKKVIATIIYSPDKPLGCGATVWIETFLNIKAK